MTDNGDGFGKDATAIDKDSGDIDLVTRTPSVIVDDLGAEAGVTISGNNAAYLLAAADMADQRMTAPGVTKRPESKF
jgi:hypothetical protein